MPNPTPTPPAAVASPTGSVAWPQPYKAFAYMVVEATNAINKNLYGLRLLALALQEELALIRRETKIVTGRELEVVARDPDRTIDIDQLESAISKASFDLVLCKEKCVAGAAVPFMVIQLRVTLSTGEVFDVLVPETDKDRAIRVGKDRFPTNKSVVYVRSFFVKPGSSYATQFDGTAP